MRDWMRASRQRKNKQMMFCLTQTTRVNFMALLVNPFPPLTVLHGRLFILIWVASHPLLFCEKSITNMLNHHQFDRLPQYHATLPRLWDSVLTILLGRVCLPVCDARNQSCYSTIYERQVVLTQLPTQWREKRLNFIHITIEEVWRIFERGNLSQMKNTIQGQGLTSLPIPSTKWDGSVNPCRSI
jgi:hypothetical protein